LIDQLGQWKVGLTVHISQFTGSNKMSDETGDSQGNTQNSGSDVGPAKEGLFTTNPRHCGDDHRLGAIE